MEQLGLAGPSTGLAATEWSTVHGGKANLEALYLVGTRSTPLDLPLQLPLIIAILRFAADVQLVQGRHTHIHIASVEHIPGVAVEEGEEQGANVGPIHISIRQEDDLQVRITSALRPQTLTLTLHSLPINGWRMRKNMCFWLQNREVGNASQPCQRLLVGQ